MAQFTGPLISPHMWEMFGLLHTLFTHQGIDFFVGPSVGRASPWLLSTVSNGCSRFINHSLSKCACGVRVFVRCFTCGCLLTQCAPCGAEMCPTLYNYVRYGLGTAFNRDVMLVLFDMIRTVRPTGGSSFASICVRHVFSASRVIAGYLHSRVSECKALGAEDTAIAPFLTVSRT